MKEVSGPAHRQIWGESDEIRFKNGPVHPQVWADGNHFPCDEEILPFVNAIRASGYATIGSCQALDEIGGAHVGRFVSIHAEDKPVRLTNFLYYMQKESDCWSELHFHAHGDYVWAALHWRPESDESTLAALAKLTEVPSPTPPAPPRSSVQDD